VIDLAKLENRRGRHALDHAKSIVAIPALWRRLGLPGDPKPSCCSPLREDRHPSFSISADDRLWRDHATNDGGDAVSFIERATGCSTADAIARLVEIAGTAPSPTPRPPTRPKTLRLPTLTEPTVGECAELKIGRGWPLFAGIEIARQRGLFHTRVMQDDGDARPSWLLTDTARRAAQVRRLDCQPWAWNKAKAWSLGGSDGFWPIGCADIGDRPLVAFVEGGPDLLAVLTLAFLGDIHDQVGACFMAGASSTISPEALQHFSLKRVRIFEHADKAGAAAGPRWAEQLTQAGATVDGFTFDPPHKDLADVLAATDAEQLEPPVNVFAGIMEDEKCL